MAKSDEPKDDLLEGEGKGVGPQKKIPQIEKAAKAYVKVRNDRMALTEKEVDAKAVLMAAMKDNEIEVYKYEDMIAERKLGKETVSVHKIDDDE